MLNLSPGNVLIMADNLMADFRSFYGILPKIDLLEGRWSSSGARKKASVLAQNRTPPKFILPELLLRGFCGWPPRTVVGKTCERKIR